MSQNQEKIKTLLYQVSAQYSEEKPYDFRKSYFIEKKFKQQADQSFRELTDWTDKNKLFQSTSLPKIGSDREQLNDRVQNIDFTSYRSSLLRNSNNQSQNRNSITPVAVRFNSKAFANSLRRSLMTFQNPIKNEQNSIQKRIKPKPCIKKVSISELKEIYPPHPIASPRNHDKYTGVLRLLKKRQKARCQKYYRANNIELTTKKLF